ncbi:hypothetical protein O181_009072 [Austropuccinia psidii MF-1]|uniref:Uncharacterized protein n=1 Tax=Austropuccinia psidii MF-1 TaxID=1389203 RepID=A0A9Q3BQ32_9BASI|nr:hypothetical protein [Austropuccinia psidii MF-1]
MHQYSFPTFTSFQTDKITGQCSRPSYSYSKSSSLWNARRISKTTFKGLREDGQEEDENSVEQQESNGTEVFPAPVGAYQGTGRTTPAKSNQHVFHQSEAYLLATMQQITEIMANLQAASSSEASRPPAFKTPYIKATD